MSGDSTSRASLTLRWIMMLCLAGLATAMARAQDTAVPPLVGSSAGGSLAPSVVGASGDALGVPGADPISPASPCTPGSVPAMPATRVVMGPLDVIHESIFGAASKDDWHSLSLFTFFSEGWDEAFVRSPEGTNGAPKQNWFGAADGVFVRLNSVNFSFVESMTTHQGLLLAPFPWAPAKPKTDGNQYFGNYNLYLPLNQRLELLVVVPFISSNKTSSTGHYVGNFGDLAISERFRLIEQRNFSMQALLTERIPTGQTVNGNDIAFITPALEFWYNFAPKWVVRGSTGINCDTGRVSATSTYFNTLAVGHYFTDKNARVFKELVAHVAVSTLSDVLGRKDYITDVYVAPGIRFGLDQNQKWYALGAIQIPVAGPHPYGWQPMLSVARNY